MESKGNAILNEQLRALAKGLTFWQEKGERNDSQNPLMACDLNYLAFKLQVLKRLLHYSRMEKYGEERLRLFYMCSGSDEFCKIVEGFGFTLTTLDMCENPYSSNHIKKYVDDSEDSLRLLEDIVDQNDFILWDTCIGHLGERLVKKMFSLISDKVFLLGLYDVPKLDLFGERVRANSMMSNIIKNSPSTNPKLYSEVFPKCELRFAVDLGAFSLLLYDNIYDFPLNDITLARYLERANSFL